MNLHRRNKRRAFLLLETIAASLIVIEIMVLLALYMTAYVRSTDITMTRQRAFLAAEAAMSEIRAGNPKLREEFGARFAGMSLDVEREAGEGPWQGCTRIRVRVTARARNGAPAAAQLESYMRSGEP